MKLEVKISCEIGGQALPIRHRHKPVVHDCSVDLVFDSYFASLLKDGKIKVVGLEESEFLPKHEPLLAALDQSVIAHLEAFVGSEEVEEEEVVETEEEKAAKLAALSENKGDLKDPPAPPKSEEELAAEASLKAEAEALEKAKVDAAKDELKEIQAKSKQTNKDKKRAEELKKIIGE